MQKINEGETSLILAQFNSFALQRNQKKDAEAACDSALNARVANLEDKIRSILQTNSQIETQLNQVHALYEQRQQDHEQGKLPQENEIALLQDQQLYLNTTIATLSQTNLDLANQVPLKINERDVEFWKIHPSNRYFY